MHVHIFSSDLQQWDLCDVFEKEFSFPFDEGMNLSLSLSRLRAKEQKHDANMYLLICAETTRSPPRE